MKLVLAAVGAALALCACDPDNGEIDVTPDTAAENTGERVGEAVEDVADSVKDAGKALDEAVTPPAK